MTRIRIGALITTIIGAIYASAGLLSSLTEFGIGIAVAGTGMLVYGLADYLETRHDNHIYQTREQVWARRDDEAA